MSKLFLPVFMLFFTLTAHGQSITKGSDGSVTVFHKDGTSTPIVTVGSQTLDISSQGVFSAAQPVLRISRVHKTVTLIWNNLAHTSSSFPTAAGFIPASYRPPHEIRNMYSFINSATRVVVVGSNGTLGFFYLDSTFVAFATTGTGVGSISWVVN